MKTSVLIKSSVGVVVFLFLISMLGISLYLNELSNKTAAILKENHKSVLYAGDMSNSLNTLNQELIFGFLSNKNPDSSLINNELYLFKKSLQLELNNLTEPGEDRLASDIEKNYNEFYDSLGLFMKAPKTVAKILYLQKKSDNIYKQLMLLSQMNEQAIEVKTEEARVSAKSSLIQMGILGTATIIIALILTYSLSSHFNQRFYQLHNGIKEVVASNYGQRLHFDGKDEFYEISLLFNEMAEKLSENNQKSPLNLQDNHTMNQSVEDIKELKRVLKLIKGVEEKAHDLISKFEKQELKDGIL
jgi:methyl-accepting chemotaxis protein